MVPAEEGRSDLSGRAWTAHDRVRRLAQGGNVMLESGTLAVVDNERGVFRVVEEAPGLAPTLWLLDSNRHWRAVRANRVHPVGDGCPRHPRAAAEPPHRRCPVCMAIWCRDHPQEAAC
jgi:hypothetical protein